MKYFKYDLLKYYAIECQTTRPSFAQKLRLFVCGFGLHCVAVYRLGRFARALKSRWILLALPLCLVYRMLDFVIRLVYHVDLHAVSIGPGFYIGHSGSILIGEATIGSNVSLTHNVTIGRGLGGTKNGIPTIGDNVWIGTGATITGGIVIGHRVTIGSGSVISRSVPDGCLLAGNPARVIEQNYDNSELLVWRGDDAACPRPQTPIAAPPAQPAV